MNKQSVILCCLLICCLAASSSARFLADEKPIVQKEEQPVASPAGGEDKEQQLEEVSKEKVDIDIVPIIEENPQTKEDVQVKEVIPVPATEKKAETPSGNEQKKVEGTSDEDQKEKSTEPVVAVPDAKNVEEKVKNDETTIDEKATATTTPKAAEGSEEEQKKKEEVVKPSETVVGDKENTSNGFGGILVTLAFICGGALVFFVSFYRYSLSKYHIPPFTPPSFCPNLLFPRPENDPNFMEDYYMSNGGHELGISACPEKYQNFV